MELDSFYYIFQVYSIVYSVQCTHSKKLKREKSTQHKKLYEKLRTHRKKIRNKTTFVSLHFSGVQMGTRGMQNLSSKSHV